MITLSPFYFDEIVFNTRDFRKIMTHPTLDSYEAKNCHRILDNKAVLYYQWGEQLSSVM